MLECVCFVLFTQETELQVTDDPSEDFPLAHFWTDARYLRIGDGPDEVHKRSVARRELRSREPGR